MENAEVIIRNHVLIKLILDQADCYKEIDYNIELTDTNELVGRKMQTKSIDAKSNFKS